jgi:hypothetical protein
MKKVLACILSLILVVALSVSVMATGFVKSPVLNDAPEIKDFETEVDHTCGYDLAITPYEDRADLADEAQQEIEKAYEDIKANADLTKMVADLAKVAEDKKIEKENLAVSQLFDISEEDCASHTDGHGTVTIHLTADLKNFVALLHKTDAGWVVVNSAKVTGADTVSFSVDELSPFAIVVDATEEKNVSTGDNANLALYISLMAVSAVALVVVLVVMKKKSN